MTDTAPALERAIDPRSGTSYRRRSLVAAVVTLAVDAAVKVATVRWLEDDPLDLPLVTLRSARNTGIAFGLGADLPRGVITAFSAVVVGVLLIAVYRRAFPSPTGAGLIVGGGFANLVDRALNGAVIDTFAVGGWPVFNAADAALTVGVLLTFVAGGRESSAPLDEGTLR